MEKFKGVSPHKPLSKTGNEIRIIRLLPDDFTAPIRCELEHVTLSREADYEAVSYCWGDASVTEPILLDGREYPVTTNLHTGLRYLRHPNTARRLWVDSLCINQTDLAERCREIEKMRDIYQLASDVLVWLGDYKPFTRSHVQRLFDYATKAGSCRNRDDDRALISAMGYDEMWHMQAELQDFIRTRTWFQRMWVIQEVSVRPEPWLKNIAVAPNLLCGNLRLPMVFLLNVQEDWVEPSTPTQLGLPSISRALARLSVIWDGHHELIGESSLSVAGKLAWVLSLVADRFNATDPRDLIYATFGLLDLKSIPDPLRPDYSKDPYQVLLDCAVFIFTETTLINVIQYNSMTTKTLPTWAPDWQHGAQYPVGAVDKPFPGTHCRVIDGSRALEVDIVMFTKVLTMGPCFRLPDCPANLLRAWKDFVIDAEDRLQGHKGLLHEKQSFEQSLWELLVAFHTNFVELHWPGSLASIKKKENNGVSGYMSELDYGPRATGLEESFLQETFSCLAESISDKHLFNTEDGSLGIMCQPTIMPEPGDWVCSIKGAYSEFVIRQRHEKYFLVGRCERTTRAIGVAMKDFEIYDWTEQAHLRNILQEIWELNSGYRIAIY
ncbi:HET-domain-containing protein [Xylariomycetidae sp. FL0641]|nr:HET-domain-containing protein [Xylariomycetidae sp. FL0641]